MLEFWNKAFAYFWRPELPWALLFTFGLGLILFQLLPASRRAIVTSLELYGLCVLGKFSSACLNAFALHNSAEIVHEMFVVGSGLIMIHLLGLLLFRLAFPLIRLRIPRIIEDLLTFLGYIAWVLVRLRLAGMDLTSLVATSAVLTAVIAFSMQDTLGNTMGGLLLQIESSIKVGDWITIGNVAGQISEIRWRYTALETRDGETVIFPNSVLMKNSFTIVSSPMQRRPEWRRWLWFNVASSIPPGRVQEVALAAIRTADMPNVARTPEPSCVLMEFGPGFARYALRYWLIDVEPDSPTDSQVRGRLLAALQRAGIELAIAQNEVSLSFDTRKAPEEREQQRRRQALRSAEIFAVLSDEEIAQMASNLVYAPFASGDVILREGSTTGDSLYLLAEGEVDVWLDELPDRPGGHVAVLGTGEVLGEIGMMTGEPRRATLIARSYAQCYRLDRATFERVIQSRPEVAGEIARVLASREQRLRMPAGERAQPLPSGLSLRTKSILDKMREFFGFCDG
ncbi:MULTISPECIES: mechanosensitive ion channel family protein [Candidatus Accumulibacter]|uniref:Small-conductance mechanosensitive channel n=1 Tax=Candidatus Accumulibacter phosphatis TaxID=327160 RepID=A0A5S4EJK6_9PROT|nr:MULTISPECIES: mechanosensitive ion channel family protein [Candidatus Accumulibacter]MCC2869649.1 mechanosensitive ion channel family protein [Candidatus Accumulibacter phosphatis]MCM8580142.1 mechanosensitive ion channel family protein [Accumulibacter sp.]TMQ75537.1 Small-conductance mechanosensitive channel [Candidatus Accumulibacter phosphatis]HMW56483.1 mechanosensitive ion channel family protein [Accumulibacter sp.]